MVIDLSGCYPGIAVQLWLIGAVRQHLRLKTDTLPGLHRLALTTLDAFEPGAGVKLHSRLIGIQCQAATR